MNEKESEPKNYQKKVFFPLGNNHIHINNKTQQRAYFFSFCILIYRNNIKCTFFVVG